MLKRYTAAYSMRLDSATTRSSHSPNTRENSKQLYEKATENQYGGKKVIQSYPQIEQNHLSGLVKVGRKGSN